MTLQAGHQTALRLRHGTKNEEKVIHSNHYTFCLSCNDNTDAFGNGYRKDQNC